MMRDAASVRVILGKRLVNLAVLQKSTYGDKRLAVLFSLAMVIATEHQYNLAMRFENGDVLMFTVACNNYVRQTDNRTDARSINIENFKIVVGMDLASAAGASLPNEE